MERELDTLSLDDFNTSAGIDAHCALCPGDEGYHSSARRDVAIAEEKYTGKPSEDDLEIAIPAQTLLSGVSGV